MMRAVAFGLLVFASALTVVTAQEISLGHAESSAADAAAGASDWLAAIAHARAAAEAYVPGSPWADQGMRRLAAIGHAAETRSDVPNALLAYGAMRTAAAATHVPYSGTSHWQAEADEGLARVASASEGPAQSAAAAQAMLAALHRPRGPTDGSLVALALAAMATLGGLGALAFGSDGPRAKVAKAVAAGGFVAYAAVVLTN
jgi:hypothetical protein